MSYLTSPEKCNDQKNFIYNLIESTWNDHKNVRYALYVYDCNVAVIMDFDSFYNYNKEKLLGFVDGLDLCMDEVGECHYCSLGLDKGLCGLTQNNL